MRFRPRAWILGAQYSLIGYHSRFPDVAAGLAFSGWDSPIYPRNLRMPRYLVERSFPDGLQIPIAASGVGACLAMTECNIQERVSWLHSYVSVDKRRTYCIYDGP